MELVVSNLHGLPVNSKSINIISNPEEFYSELLKRSSGATTRIALSSLYLGDGHLENKLIDTIKSNIDSNAELDVVVLLDYLRGTRGARSEQSSTSLLKKIADKAKIYLYHTPDLNGFVKKVLPERTNEIVGLQHMKLYIFDNSVLISGANLSESYFTNRQDRYILIEDCKELADFFSAIIEAVGQGSFVLKGDGSINMHPDSEHHPYEGSTSDYVDAFRNRILRVLETLKSPGELSGSNSDTIIYPLLQMGAYGLVGEHSVLKDIFKLKDPSASITMASGYFNCTTEYENLIFSEGSYSLDVLTASPSANGFYGAKGVSRFIPSMYSWVAENFNRQIYEFKRTNVKLHEYSREGWTFHAKGLWINSSRMFSTIVGSSNYGYRSVNRDLEAQVLITTTDADLKRRLMEERDSLFNFASVLDGSALRRADHHVPTVVRFMSRFIRNFF